MSRQDEFSSKSKNPATKFLEWNSDANAFRYYDKVKGENVIVPKLKFLVLKELSTIKGWNDASGSGIYSNEVMYVSTEELNVRTFEGKKIAKGLYKDIKADVKIAGGRYVKSVYAITDDGEIVNIQLKGSNMSEWIEFTKKTRNRLSDEWVEFSESNEGSKNSRIKYFVPIFKFAGSLNKEEAKMADEKYNELQAYFGEYFKRKEEETEQIEADKITLKNEQEIERTNEVYKEAQEISNDLPF